jgi:hypothetical protein
MIARCLAFALALAISFSSSVNAATTYNFLFDDTGGGPDGTIGTPIVGFGNFASPFDLAPGIYALSSLAGFSMNFAFGPETFLTSDIATPIDEVAVEITNYDATRDRLVFIENGSPGDGGPFEGALDLVDSAGNVLSFEPTSQGGHNLYFEAGSSSFLGNYLALSGSAPEPATWALLLLGFMGIGFVVSIGTPRKAIRR